MDTSFTELLSLDGRVACVTGAARGIGYATAERLVQQGALVHAADQDAAGLERLCASIPGTVPHVYDQADLASVRSLAEALGPIDILVANAGILVYRPILETEISEVARIVGVNLTGTIALVQEVGRSMVGRGRGAVILTTSQLAFNGSEFRGAYAASKAGITQFTKTAALEWGRRGVRVNAVAPGRTLTDINRHLLSEPQQREEALKRIPLGRFGEPEDIARAIAFLASDAASYVTGHTLIVDGGWILP
jgi:NAD(P)-dependent dehydrogenase (short-subunit alcohol dehydrogenase family)